MLPSWIDGTAKGTMAADIQLSLKKEKDIQLLVWSDRNTDVN